MPVESEEQKKEDGHHYEDDDTEDLLRKAVNAKNEHEESFTKSN